MSEDLVKTPTPRILAGYLLVVGYPNGDVEYYGPFRTKERAVEYCKAVEDEGKKTRMHIAPVITPYRD